MSTVDTDGMSAARERAVALFAAGWRRPGPHAWDELLAVDVELHQPLMPDGRGRQHWERELGRLLEVIPDLRGEVLGWAGRDDVVFVDIRCAGTAGGRPLAFRAVDRLTLDADGRAVRRDTFFDPGPVVAALLRRPRVWPAWWRSGAAPVTARRRLVDRRRAAASSAGS